MQESGMRLYEHLCNCSCSTKVAINLEWWVSIKHIGIRTAVRRGYCYIRVEQYKLILENLHGMVAVKHSGPHSLFPSHRPSTGSIATSHKTFENSLIESRIFVRRNLIARIGTPKM